MPFLSYEVSVEEAVRNAGRLLKEGRANCVKLEGGREVCPQVSAIVAAGIPVMGHLGLTPQSINAFGGFKVQGKSEAAARKLIDDAKALEEAGAFAIVLECVPAKLAALVTKAVNVPTIGIGAGAGCDGQILKQDMPRCSAISPRSSPSASPTWARPCVAGFASYISEVREGIAFAPGAQHVKIDEKVEKLRLLFRPLARVRCKRLCKQARRRAGRSFRTPQAVLPRLLPGAKRWLTPASRPATAPPESTIESHFCGLAE